MGKEEKDYEPVDRHSLRGKAFNRLREDILAGRYKEMEELKEVVIGKGLCAAWACDNITEEELSEMEETVFLADFHIGKGHFEQVVELDDKFHKLLYNACGSRILSRLLADYHHYAKKVRTSNLSTEERARHSLLEHKKIVEAIRAKDEESARSYAYEHIVESIKRMYETK